MTKDKFIAAVARESGLTSAQTQKALRAIENVAAQTLKEEGAVRVPGLVLFKRHDIDERIVRNPRTRQEMVMGPSVMVKAKPVNGFADRIKQENTPHAG